MDWSKLIDWIKLSPKYLLPIILVSGILIFAPTSFLAILGLDTFIILARPWIGIIFLLSSSLLIVNIFYSVYDWFKAEHKKKKIKGIRQERLHKLTPREKEIFLGYILNDTRTQYLDYSDGVARGLEAEGFIFMSSNVGDLDSWSYNIQPWVWDLFKNSFKSYFSEDDVTYYKTQQEIETYHRRGR
jgi:hypothetical protein